MSHSIPISNLFLECVLTRLSCWRNHDCNLQVPRLCFQFIRSKFQIHPNQGLSSDLIIVSHQTLNCISSLPLWLLFHISPHPTRKADYFLKSFHRHMGQEAPLNCREMELFKEPLSSRAIPEQTGNPFYPARSEQHRGTLLLSTGFLNTGEWIWHSRCFRKHLSESHRKK